MTKNVLVIGCGNMPQALLAPSAGFHFMTYTPSQTRAKVLAEQLQGEFIEDLDELDWKRVDIILLGCKPQQLQVVSEQIKNKLTDHMLIISMLAGVELETQRAFLSRGLPHEKLVRIMPNITSQVGKGSILVYPEPTQYQADFAFLEMQAKLYPAQTEEIFDQLMLITGSGPAYIFYLVRSFERHLDKLGLDSKVYRKAIEDTFSGALDIMKKKDDLSTTQLISKVASKGGVTQEAIGFFDRNDLDSLIDGAMKAGVEKSKQLQKDLG